MLPLLLNNYIMAKSTTSFRLSDKTRSQLENLAELFKESQTDILEKAVNLLYESREEHFKADMEERLNRFREEKK
jgi:predicted transcriptional regulator